MVWLKRRDREHAGGTGALRKAIGSKVPPNCRSCMFSKVCLSNFNLVSFLSSCFSLFHSYLSPRLFLHFSILSPLLVLPKTCQMGFVTIIITLDYSSDSYEPPCSSSYQVRICHDSRLKREVITHRSHAITLLANGGGKGSGECVYSSSSQIKCQHFTAGVSGH